MGIRGNSSSIVSRIHVAMSLGSVESGIGGTLNLRKSPLPLAR